ncbi:MAG TPA: serine/threonine-protein kinase [Myxococcota bacterium]|nr:serine/threonine-protein kinase [Myxococcota bacterium]HRY92732.1 serine/threonine-protein kinase [Myxococcota bacterium]HSA20726.1 serine/threonine-protein kinase [Myxococcota bacterium]
MADDDQQATLPPPGEGPAGPGPAELPRGANLGRYVILEKLGAGGMGVVYAAYDSGLDRKVAVKVLRPETRGEELAVRQDRLLREARAMARLSNPNVNTVFDVGAFQGRLYLAMELVDGQTLKGWLSAQPRTWREVAGVFLQAGRGLLAAHQAGLVHRDVKPDNLLVGRDGRVRVTDFGLVSSGGAEPEPALPAAPVGTGDDGGLTRTGALLGSPAYMAPEQLEGGRATPASDQFSFCVALHEALTGARPFSGDSPAEVLNRIRAGQVTPGPRAGAVPTFLLQAVRRGLSADPAARHPDLEVLLAELARDPARTRRRALAWSGGLLALALGGAGLAFGLGGGQAVCADPERHLAGAWDPGVKGRVQAAFAATGLPQAGSTFQRLERRLDAYAAAWAAGRREACEATQVHGEQSPALMDLRMRCLDRRLEELRALGGVLAGADDEVMARAEAAAAALPPLAVCRDARALSLQVEPPADPAGRQKIAEVERRLAEAEALLQAGRFEAALSLAAPAVALAVEVGHDPTRAEALLVLGRTQDANGKLEEAEASLRAAQLAAEAGRHDRATVEAWLQLVSVVGARRGRYQEGQRLAEQARAALARLGGDRTLEATLAIQLGDLLTQEQRYAEAQGQYETALEIRRALLGPDDPAVLDALSSLATNLRQQTKTAEAERLQREVLAGVERSLGAEHPRHAQAESDLAAILFEAGRQEESLELQRHALGTWEKTLRPGHPSLGNAINRMAAALLKLGRMDEAIETFHRAHAIHLAAYGPNHTQTAGVVYNLGVLYNMQKKYDLAQRQFELAAAGYEAAQGPASPKVATIEYAICGMLRLQGRLEEGLAHCRRSREVSERIPGAPPLQLARTLVAIGQSTQNLGQPAEAIEPLERAVVLHQQGPTPALEVAEGRFELARALWAAKRDRPRARALAAQAWEFFKQAKDVDEAQRAEIAAWVKARGLGRAP